MNLEELKTKIEADLNRQAVTSRVLLDRCRVIDEASRKSGAYLDDRYFPFYYFLGKYLTPATLLEFGVRLGFSGYCFLTSCKTVKHYLGFQQRGGEYYSLRLAMANIRDRHRGSLSMHLGKLSDPELVGPIARHEWEVVLVNDELNYDLHMAMLEMAWQHMADGGVLVQDHALTHQPARTALANFAKMKNRAITLVGTRHGVGLIEK